MSKADLFLFNFKRLTKSVKRLTEKNIYLCYSNTSLCKNKKLLKKHSFVSFICICVKRHAFSKMN